MATIVARPFSVSAITRYEPTKIRFDLGVETSLGRLVIKRVRYDEETQRILWPGAQGRFWFNFVSVTPHQASLIKKLAIRAAAKAEYKPTSEAKE